MAVPPYSNPMTRWIFKLLRPSEREEATGNIDYRGSAADVNDGFIHFSTAAQLAGTAGKHFTDTDKIHILAFDSSNWTTDELKWEPSRGGALFPHLYGPLDISSASMEWTLKRGNRGDFDLDDAIKWEASHA